MNNSSPSQNLKLNSLLFRGWLLPSDRFSRQLLCPGFLPTPTFWPYFHSREWAEEREGKKFLCLLPQAVQKDGKADMETIASSSNCADVCVSPYFSAKGVVIGHQPQWDRVSAPPGHRSCGLQGAPWSSSSTAAAWRHFPFPLWLHFLTCEIKTWDSSQKRNHKRNIMCQKLQNSPERKLEMF